MKFVEETGKHILIHGYEAGKISVSGISADHPGLKNGDISLWDADNHLGIIHHSVTIHSRGEIRRWTPQNHAEFEPEHFLALASRQPEVILIGTGRSLQFPPADCLTVMQQQQLGYEIMDTAAACRTFNVLTGEGRDVILAMLMLESMP